MLSDRYHKHLASPLPNDKIFHLLEFKAFAYDKLNVIEIFFKWYEALWEMDKKLVISILSVSYNVFKRLFLQGLQK